MPKKEVVKEVKGEQEGLTRFLIIFKDRYKEVKGRDWWDARKQGSKWIKEEFGTDLPLGLLEKFIKVVKLEDKYTLEDFKGLV